MSRYMIPAVLSLLLACNGGKNNDVEGVPDAIAEQAGDGVASIDGTDSDGSAASSPVVEELTPEMIEARVNEAAAWLTTRQPEQASTALATLKELSVEAPDLAEIPYNMGVAYEILGDDTEARKRYLRATDIDPTLGEAWLNLGALAEREGDLNRALQAYRAGLRNAADNPELTAGVIGVLRKLGKHESAIAEARTALAKNANNVNAYNNLGLVYIDQGNLDLAQFIYQKALADIPGASDNALIHANLGQVFLLQEKTGNARLEFEKALELQPDLVAAKMLLAQLHMDNRDWEATSEVLESALEVEPENPAIHTNLGIAYRGLGQLEKAQASYEKALELEPANPDPYLNLAILFADHMQAYDAALQALETYTAQGGTRAELVEEWDTAIRKEQKKFERAQERKKRREEAKKREELARQAAEQEAAEEAARQAAEEAAQQAAEQEAASQPQDAEDGAGIDGAGLDGMAPSVGTPTEEASEGGSDGGDATGGDTPWGGEGTQSASVGEILQAAESGGILGMGESCSAVGGCSNAALECSSGGTCQEAGSLGTYLYGVGCSADTDCAIGLACISQVCSEPPSSTPVVPPDDTNTPDGSGDNPWGQ